MQCRWTIESLRTRLEVVTVTDPLMKMTKAELVKMIRELSDTIGSVPTDAYGFSARVADVQRDGYGNHVVTLEVNADAAAMAVYDIREGAEMILTNEEMISDVDVFEYVEVPEAAA